LLSSLGRRAIAGATHDERRRAAAETDRVRDEGTRNRKRLSSNAVHRANIASRRPRSMLLGLTRIAATTRASAARGGGCVPREKKFVPRRDRRSDLIGA
jgi:hypothetical protein